MQNGNEITQNKVKGDFNVSWWYILVKALILIVEVTLDFIQGQIIAFNVKILNIDCNC